MLRTTETLVHSILQELFTLVDEKDADLESALSRNRRWIVNNQIKNIILRCPNQVASVKFLQKKFKTLDLQGKAVNWLKKYPCCFEIFLEGDEYFFRLTKRMISLVEEEDLVKDQQEPVLVERLAKLLMLSKDKRLNVVKFNELKRNFGFPDDYVIRILPKYPDIFKIVNYSGSRNALDIELVSWEPSWAVSAIEIRAQEAKTEPHFSCHVPPSWIKARERFFNFDKIPYISPYLNASNIEEGSEAMEKRCVALVHELLSLTLWKKLSIIKLEHFKKEFILPEKLNMLLLRHPGIFYVSNRYKIYTVLLREGYHGAELVSKDPLVIVKEKFGEIMQEGLHEYNRRRHALNLEKKKKKGILMGGTGNSHEEKVNNKSEQGEVLRREYTNNAEERKRFYKILFQDESP